MFFSFRGRINRWQWCCGVPVSLIAPFWTLEAIVLNPNKFWVAVLISSPFLWMLFAIHIKRNHDRNNPWYWTIFTLAGWAVAWVFLKVLKAQGAIYFLWIIFFGCVEGHDGENKYGPPPDSLKAWWAKIKDEN